MRKILATFAILLVSSSLSLGQGLAPPGPGALPGVQGPTSATSGHIATYNGTTGKVLQDGGVVPTSSPCGAFGTTAGTCLQGAGNAGTPSAIVLTNATGFPASAAAFQAYAAAGQTTVTGDGTAYTLSGLTEEFDNGNNFNNTTGVFTAPGTGLYYCQATFNMSSLGIATGVIVNLVTTGATYRLFDGGIASAAAGEGSFGGGTLLSLASTNTVSATITISGTTKTVTLDGAATRVSWLGCYRIT